MFICQIKWKKILGWLKKSMLISFFWIWGLSTKGTILLIMCTGGKLLKKTSSYTV